MLERYRDGIDWKLLEPAILALGAIVLAVVLGAIIGGL